MSQPTSEQLGKTFCEIISDWLDVESIDEINRRNSLPEYAGICAWHDFCDPNQAMIESLEKYGFEFDQDLIPLINEAWDKAKQLGFAAERFENGL